MRTCTFYSYDTGVKELVGKAILNDNGTVSFEIAPGHDLEMSRVLATSARVKDEKVRIILEENPRKWFDNLPFTFQGIYFWAAFEK